MAETLTHMHLVPVPSPRPCPRARDLPSAALRHRNHGRPLNPHAPPRSVPTCPCLPPSLQLCVFHLGSGRLVHSARHHRVNVRDVDYDPRVNRLATCSFDKTVKVYGEGEGEGEAVEQQAP